ncbi:SIMPL domain-containing protein [Aneurinibacillus migulanus]|uniref:SIMPL domain-containing protein n=2 Tax=Aneurinibacillus migulanus TaxID=47500 RepID=A0A1G8XSE1_ANEMI|nr:SIMPL domain-containing protein [Aneurinibacillus migulanus]KIV50850.1 hypothetical protein TS65_28960 [Aneurinibacillus migulanus]MED0894245.1 SIMPL domain-containing protein [Aneurinibacillus migulanus]MED1616929.1 SIMPL domain-containing protein [Aneurinibacillus migulanus]MED4729611.1 SIMPL domain-containing protein [Aneurinibacillus migulanus]SDJ93413.1 hypothetical protein SAMN04487909_1334 [Aneurinibacillus migulanus]
MYYNQSFPPYSMMSPSFPSNNQYIIKVSGEGSIPTTPDRAIIVLGAITESPNISTAQKENAETMSNIINSLMELGIPRENLKTVEYRIDIQYDYEDGKQTFRGYKVTYLLQITIDKIDQTGLVIDTAVKNGANSVSDIKFTVAHPNVYYNQALSLAIKNAEQKAVTIAKTLGATLHQVPNQVQEVSATSEPVPYQTALYAKSVATPIQPGQLEISAKITAEYSYYQ